MLRDTLTLAFGAVASRLLGLISMPILARIYTPEAFGEFGIYMSILLILSPLASLRYVNAIPLSKSEKMAFSTLVVSILCPLVIGVVILFVIFLCDKISQSLSSDYFDLALMIPVSVGVVASAELEAMNSWATRKHKFKYISNGQLFQTLFGEGLKIGFGLTLGPMGQGLMLGNILGYLMACFYLLRKFWRALATNSRTLRLRGMKRALRRYIKFPLIRLPAQAINSLALQVPVLAISASHGIDTVGQMAMANSLFTLPFILFGQSTSRAYFASAAKIGSKNMKELRSLAWNVIGSLFLVSVPISVILFFFGSNLVSIAIGEQWDTAGKLVSILSISLTPQFVSSTIIRTLDIVERHSTLLYLHISRLLLAVAVFVFAYFLNLDILDTMLIYTLVLSLHYVIQAAVIMLQVLPKSELNS